MYALKLCKEAGVTGIVVSMRLCLTQDNFAYLPTLLDLIEM